MSELLDCPHCQGEARYWLNCDIIDCYMVRCVECGSKMRADSRENVIQKWNRRALGWIDVADLTSVPEYNVLATDGANIVFGELYPHQGEFLCMQKGGHSVMRHVIAYKIEQPPKSRIKSSTLGAPRKGDYSISVKESGEIKGTFHYLRLGS